MNNHRLSTLSVIGLGKLGAPMLATFCDAGYTVIGVDTNPVVVEAINAGRAPVAEPGLQDALNRCQGRYRATDDIRRAVVETDATFVIVPTPTGADGGFSLDYARPVCQAIGEALAFQDAYHLVFIVCTVMPGQTRELCGVIEQASGRHEGEGFGLCYSPEFIRLGAVMHDLKQPDYVLIGCEDDQAGASLEVIYSQVHSAPIVRTNWVNAEIAKIAQNSYLTLKITFANELGRLCGAIPGANVDEVTHAIGQDSRIGPKFLRSGTAYGGPCFPRDNRAFSVAAENLWGHFALGAQVDDLNDGMLLTLFHKVFWAADRAGAHTIGILGLSYKPGTPVIEESASIHLAQRLAEVFDVVVYDPLAIDEARQVLGDTVQYAESAAGLIEQCEVVVLMHPEPVAVDLSGVPVLIDPWRVYARNGTAHHPGLHYIPLGIGPRESEAVTA